MFVSALRRPQPFLEGDLRRCPPTSPGSTTRCRATTYGRTSVRSSSRASSCPPSSWTRPTRSRQEAALADQAGTGKRLGEVLVDRGWLYPQDIARALAAQFGFVYVDIHHVSVDLAAARKLDPEVGQRCCAIGVRMIEGTLLVAVADPTSDSLSEVRRAIDCPVTFAVCERDDIRNAWRRMLAGHKP